jgi:hypothetical protein
MPCSSIVDFGFSGKTGHVFCLPICNPSFVILKLIEGSSEPDFMYISILSTCLLKVEALNSSKFNKHRPLKYFTKRLH